MNEWPGNAVGIEFQSFSSLFLPLTIFPLSLSSSLSRRPRSLPRPRPPPSGAAAAAAAESEDLLRNQFKKFLKVSLSHQIESLLLPG